MICSNVTLLLAGSLVALPVPAQESAAGGAGAGQESAQAAPVDVFRLEWAGIGKFLTSAKDQGLLGALRMLDQRIAELPEEFGEGEQIPPDLLPLLAFLREGRTVLRVGFSEPGPDSPVPFYAFLELDGGAAATSPLERLENLLLLTGMEPEPPDAQGRMMLPLPLPAWYRDAGGKLVVAVGSEGGPIDGEELARLPAGATESLRVRFDYAALMDRGLPILESMGTEVGELRTVLDATGLSSVAIEYALGSDATRSYFVSAVSDFADSPMGAMLADEPLPASALELVPADAEWAFLGAYDMAGLVDAYTTMLTSIGEMDAAYTEEMAPLLEGLAEVRAVLQHVGHVQGMYASDTTGGGGMYSTVAFASLANPDAFVAALDGWLAHVDEFGRSTARGYVHVRREQVDGVRTTSLVFPGLPIPIEPTYAVSGNQVFAGLSPVSVRGALAQAKRGGAGLSANEHFTEQMGALPADLHGLFFFDTQRLLRAGYAQAAGVGTALANAVRSPSDAARDPGPVIPTYSELAEGALAMVATMRVRDGDFVCDVRSDPSRVVNGTALWGYFGKAYLLSIFASAAAQGAAQKMEAAGPSASQEQLRASSDIAALCAVLDAYAANNDGQYPPSLEVLTVPDELDNVYLPAERLVDPWGNTYQYGAPKRAGRQPRVFSYGADGAKGGEGEYQDILRTTVFEEPKSPFESLLESLFE